MLYVIHQYLVIQLFNPVYMHHESKKVWTDDIICSELSQFVLVE